MTRPTGTGAATCGCLGPRVRRADLHGVVSGRVRRDGANSARELARLVGSYGGDHLGLILLQGIALAGFNGVDLHALHAHTGLPALVVAPRLPNPERIRRALLEQVPGAKGKWRLVQQAGEMEPCGGVWVQRV